MRTPPPSLPSASAAISRPAAFQPRSAPRPAARANRCPGLTVSRLFLLGAAFHSPGLTAARAEKLEVTVNWVQPLIDTDTSASGTDFPDLSVRITVTPQDGTAQQAETPVVSDVMVQTKALEAHKLPVFTIPPRPVRIAWEIRDQDGEAQHLMSQGHIDLPNNDEPWTGGSTPPGEALGSFTVRWAPDWAKVFGVVSDGENGTLDLQGVADKMTAALSGHPKVIKFGYRLALGLAVLEHAEGTKRGAADPPAMPDFLITDRFNPASVTKTFTAAALLRAMEQEGVGPDQSIAPYLPSSWTKGPGISGITFRQVLDHTSGIRAKASTWAALRETIAAGVKASDKVYDYSNTGYCLCRVLLARIKNMPEIDAVIDAVNTSAVFTNFVRTEMLTPLGITGVNWKPDPVTGALFYPHDSGQPLSQLKGTGFGDVTLREGAHGIQLSLREISQVFTRLWNPGASLSKTMLNRMRDGDLGGRMVNEPLDGPAFVKGGYFPQSSWGAQESSCVVRFGNGLTAVVMVNGGVNAFDTLMEAYNSSWYEPSANPRLHHLVTGRAAELMKTAPRLAGPVLESAMGSVNASSGHLPEAAPAEGLRLLPDGAGEPAAAPRVRLSWEAATDTRIMDTVWHSTDLRNWTAVETIPGREGGGALEKAYPVTRGMPAGYYRIGRVREADTPSLISVINSAPPRIPFAGDATTLSEELLSTGIRLTGVTTGRSTTRAVRPPLNDKPPIRLEVDGDEERN